MNLGRCNGDGETWTDGRDLGAKWAVLGAWSDGLGWSRGSPPALRRCYTQRWGTCPEKLCNMAFLSLCHHIAFIMCPRVYGHGPLWLYLPLRNTLLCTCRNLKQQNCTLREAAARDHLKLWAKVTRVYENSTLWQRRNQSVLINYTSKLDHVSALTVLLEI